MLGTAAARAEQVSYDSLGRVISVITDDGKQTLYAYDAAGNRTGVAVTATAGALPTAAAHSLSYSYGGAAPTFDPRTDTTNPIAGVSPPQFGAATFTGSLVTYTPSAFPVAGTDTFAYTVQNAATGFTASAPITVTLINPAPIAAPAAIIVAENASAYGFDPNPAHHPFTVTGVGAALSGTSGFTFSMASYQPAANFWGQDGFTYTIVNGQGPSATAPVSVTVTATPPTVGPVGVGTASNRPVTFDPRIYATDPQGLPLTVTAVSPPSHGAAAANNGVSVTYTPAMNYVGTDSFTYAIANGGGGTAGSTVTVTVGAALSVQLNKATWAWHRFVDNPPIVQGAVSATVSGGQSPYTLAWQFISGQNTPTATAPNWLSTQWTWPVQEDNTLYSSTWRLQVTDSLNTVIYSPQVTVTFEWDNNN